MFMVTRPGSLLIPLGLHVPFNTSGGLGYLVQPVEDPGEAADVIFQMFVVAFVDGLDNLLHVRFLYCPRSPAPDKGNRGR